MGEREILPGLISRQPSKIKPGCASEESFLGDALSERARDRIRMKAVSLTKYHGLHHRCSVFSPCKHFWTIPTVSYRSNAWDFPGVGHGRKSL